MQHSETAFLFLLRTALQTTPGPRPAAITAQEAEEISRLSLQHHIQPMILDAAWQCGLADAFPAAARTAAQAAVLQTQRTAHLLALCKMLTEQGVPFCVLGGSAALAWYAHPEQQNVSEEHLAFHVEHQPFVENALLEKGFQKESMDIFANRPLQQFVHVHPVSDETQIGSAIIQAEPFPTPEIMQQFRWFIGTAVKGNTSSRSRLMAICDLCLFLERSGAELDWQKAEAWCREQGFDSQVHAMLKIGITYLGFTLSACPQTFLSYEEDLSPVWQSVLTDTTEASESYNTFEHLSAIRAGIEAGKAERLRVSGWSMTPFLVHRRDYVMLKKPDRPLKAGDIVFYQRESGQFILHRIYKVCGSGDMLSYDIVGDGQMQIEHDVKPEQIFGLVYEATRKGKTITPRSFWWKLFQGPWRVLLPLRPAIRRIFSRL